MKLIIAIIQPGKLEAVKAALTEVEVFRLTVLDCQGFGRQKGQTELYRGHEYKINLLRKVQLQIAVNEDFVEPTIQAISEHRVRKLAHPAERQPSGLRRQSLAARA